MQLPAVAEKGQVAARDDDRIDRQRRRTAKGPGDGQPRAVIGNHFPIRE